MEILSRFILFALLITGAWKADAASIAGVSFNDTYASGGISMPLQGVGLKNVLFFKAFVAAYYLGPATPNEIPAQRIEVEYFVNIPAAKLTNYTIDRMKFNVTKEEMDAIREENELMGKYFVDLKPGDRFALTYIPGVGTQFEHKGTITGVIPGSVFAKALFSVWVGDKPFDEPLKQAIMGGNNSGQSVSEGITPGYATRIVTFGPAETEMEATVTYSVLGKYRAQFKHFKGSIAIDETSNTIQSVLIDIDAASVASTCSWCDKVVRSDRLLDTSVFPKIIFKGNDMIKTDKGLLVNGVLELHGHTNAVTLPVNVTDVSNTLEVYGAWDIKRKDFGIIWSKYFDMGGLVVGDLVHVTWYIKLPNMGIKLK